MGSWNNEFGYFLTKMDCGYYYNIAICDFDPAEDNYEDFCNLPSTREALHVGQMPFPNPGDVYFSMINVFMESQMEDIEFILNAGYKTLIYDGNFDIICNHSGVLDMMLTCSGMARLTMTRLVGRLTTMGPRWLAT